VAAETAVRFLVMVWSWHGPLPAGNAGLGHNAVKASTRFHSVLAFFRHCLCGAWRR